MKTPKAILFDLEGVVIDSEIVWDDVDYAWFELHNDTFKPDEMRHLVMGKSIDQATEIYKELLNLPQPITELNEERHKIAQELFSKEIAFIDGFKPFFEAQVRGRYQVAVATSLVHEFLQPIITKLKLDELFSDHIYSIEDIGFVSKPNPDIFLYAAKKLGMSPSDCIVFEDAPHGVEAAEAAGMYCIAITTSTSRDRLTKADQIIDSYSEIVI